MSGTGLVRVRGCLKGRYNFLVPDPGSGICFLPDHGHKFDISIYYFCFEGGGSTEGVDGAGMVADPEPDWIRIQSFLLRKFKFI